MPEKEVEELLKLELRLESKLAKTKLNANNIPIKALQEAKDAVQILQSSVDQDLKKFQENLSKECQIKCMKLQEKAELEKEIIQSCYDDLDLLAKKTIKDLLGDLE